MLKRYWQMGIVAATVMLVAMALVAAKTYSRNPGTEPGVIELTAEDAVPALAPETGPAALVTEGLSKAVLDVQGMSCSGCVNEIKNGLARVEGIGEVLVDLSSGSVDVFYDEDVLTDTAKIASAITAVGYPATLARTLTPAEIEKENTLLASKSRLYIAAVGDWEIARSDFDIELAHARARYEKLYGQNVFDDGQGDTLLQRLKSQVATRLITEGVQMQEVQKAGFKLAPETVSSEFQAFLTRKGMTPEAFKGALQASGYDFEYYIKKFENQLTINRYVAENVISGISDEIAKRQLYTDWFNNARLLAKVVYYDRQLQAIAKGGSASSGCGSSCTKN